MLRRNFFASAIALFAGVKLFATRRVIAGANEKFAILHEPVVVGGGEDAVVISVVANKLSLAQVEVASVVDPSFKKPRVFVQSAVSGKKHLGTVHNIKISGLKGGAKYRYRIILKEVKKYWEPYRKGEKYGETVLGETLDISKNSDGRPLEFTTPTAGAESLSFAVINDLHENRKKYGALLSGLKHSEYDFIVANGDSVNYMMTEPQLFGSAIGCVADAQKGVKPVYFLRGNHETRGKLAEEYFTYYPTVSGKSYFAFKAAGVFFIFLDVCEDKPDNSTEGAHLNNFTDYRNEEFDWLRGVLASSECRNSKRRVVVQHIPSPFEYVAYSGKRDKRMASLLHGANIDLMIAAHMHEYKYLKKGDSVLDLIKGKAYWEKYFQRYIPEAEKKITYPIVVNSNTESMLVKVTPKSINIEFRGLDGGKSRPDIVV